MLKESKTDWTRLTNMNDQDIDTSDIPELDEDFCRRAKLHLPMAQGLEHLYEDELTPRLSSDD